MKAVVVDLQLEAGPLRALRRLIRALVDQHHRKERFAVDVDPGAGYGCARCGLRSGACTCEKACENCARGRRHDGRA